MRWSVVLNWRIEYNDQAERAILALEKPARSRILKFMRERVASLEDPASKAKALKGHLRGLYRFRVGDYRVICDIQRDRVVVLVLDAGHRKDVYE